MKLAVYMERVKTQEKTQQRPIGSNKANVMANTAAATTQPIQEDNAGKDLKAS